MVIHAQPLHTLTICLVLDAANLVFAEIPSLVVCRIVRGSGSAQVALVYALAKTLQITEDSSLGWKRQSE